MEYREEEYMAPALAKLLTEVAEATSKPPMIVDNDRFAAEGLLLWYAQFEC